MAAEILFPHAFANMEVTIPNLESFCQQWDIISPQKNFVFMDESGEKIFFSETPQFKEECNFISENPFHPEKTRLMLKEDLKIIKSTQEGIQKFLDSCIDGKMPYFEILNVYKLCERKNYLTVIPLQGDQWHVQPTIADAVKLAKSPLPDYLYIRGLLLPALGGKHDPIQFAWTKQCQSCGKYFQAKGPKSTFCSETCRSRVRFKTKR